MKKCIHSLSILLLIVLAIGMVSCDSITPAPASSPTSTSASTSTPAHSHTYESGWTYDALCHWHKATCEHGDEVSAKAEHTFGADESCSVCGYQKPVEKCQHEQLTLVAAIEATCTENGAIAYRKCNSCNALFADENAESKITLNATVIPATGHTIVEDAAAVAPTCLTAGSTASRHCSLCDWKEESTVLPALGHTVVEDAAKEATCTENGKAKGEHCSVCELVITAQESIPALGHTYAADNKCTVCGADKPACQHQIVIDKAIAATCTEPGKTEGKHCSVCNEILVAVQTVPSKGHNLVEAPAFEPTCTEIGRTSGKFCTACSYKEDGSVLPAKGHTPGSAADCTHDQSCTVCGILLAKKHGHTLGAPATATEDLLCAECGIVMAERFGAYDPSSYNSDYGYRFLASMPKGASMQALYSEMKAYATAFHLSSTMDVSVDASGNYAIKRFNFQEKNLTLDEALAVWTTLKNDNPLFYWISNMVSYSSSEIVLLTDSEYALGTTRQAYNAAIYQAVASLNFTGTAHEIALAAHDKILGDMEYALESDGVTPSNASWAHNILGYFEKQEGVCEAYTKAFQLILNYYGIENLFVSGTGNGGYHAWNLAKMDDGAFYWFDLTWDDQTGVPDAYLCKNDTDALNGFGTDNFLDHHAYNTSATVNQFFLYDLPARSQSTFAAE